MTCVAVKIGAIVTPAPPACGSDKGTWLNAYVSPKQLCRVGCREGALGVLSLFSSL